MDNIDGEGYAAVEIGQMFAFAKMGEWDKVDSILMKIDEKLWLNTEMFEDVNDFIDFIQKEFDIDLY